MNNPIITDRQEECVRRILNYLRRSWGIHPSRIVFDGIIKKHFPEPSPTTEPLYRIKPLVFENRNCSRGWHFAFTPFGEKYWVCTQKDGPGYVFPDAQLVPCKLKKESEKACQDHYRAFIAAALEVVEG